MYPCEYKMEINHCKKALQHSEPEFCESCSRMTTINQKNIVIRCPQHNMNQCNQCIVVFIRPEKDDPYIFNRKVEYNWNRYIESICKLTKQWIDMNFSMNILGASPRSAVNGCHKPREFSALVWINRSFEAATIFIAFVIFWIFLTLFIRFLTTWVEMERTPRGAWSSGIREDRTAVIGWGETNLLPSRLKAAAIAIAVKP